MTRAGRALLLAAALLALPLSAHAGRETLVLPTLLGEYRLVYDSSRVNESDLRPLAVLSPHLAGWDSLAVTPRLERCVVGDADYLDCRDRSVRSSNFLWNARINLKRGAAMLDRLRALRVPAELDPVLAWLQSSLAFSLWLEETKLDFYRTGDFGTLQRRYGETDPTRGCAVALEQVRTTLTPEAQPEIAILPWHNCVNALFRRHLGDYPIAAWQQFLRSWNITERLVEQLPAGANAGR